MPETERPAYNPLIMGFAKDRGPLIISLKNARHQYGKLPSEYQLVSRKESRKVKKALNLDIGKIISVRLKFSQENLKRTVIGFFKNWHRSYEDEFGVRITPLLNLNDPQKVASAIDGNQVLLMRLMRLDVRTEMERCGLIRKDVLNSIAQDTLAETVQTILTKKVRQEKQTARAEVLRGALSEIHAHIILRSLRGAIGLTSAGFSRELIQIFADDIAAALHQITSHIPLADIERLRRVQGQGVEFQFAPRDRSYLDLGKETGDCTADKPLFQADQEIENIYWTVFPWILDRNYQILKVFFNGDFIMKAHLLPLFYLAPQGGRVILAVDAIETVRAFRDDLEGHGRAELLAQRPQIFARLLNQILVIAQGMGIEDVYAEKFSNTPWVREAFTHLPEIYINVNQLIKLDELEDVYELARHLSHESGHGEVNDIFMELQMKNTSLLPTVSKRAEGVKSYAVIRGNADDGIPMKRVIGI
jgi:hypothetical protein